MQVFVTAHESVSTKSEAMYEALKRRNYVTPTNYLEFVEGYKTMLCDKKRSLADKAGKLRGGLTKLDETTVQVGEMQVCLHLSSIAPCLVCVLGPSSCIDADVTRREIQVCDNCPNGEQLAVLIWFWTVHEYLLPWQVLVKTVPTA